ncbi:CapA family protein [uncultured Aquimarina sp.]|uniref:CapA family protein n=1 Tax=uncultured Aquimarina sp. TaxID=575652 RepID=UPI00262E3634|nr:CapA family protein [uncultured Aquimarina sp.]
MTRIIFTGDLLLDRGVREKIKHKGMDDLFHESIDAIFLSNDIVVANLECPATKIKEPIHKKFIFRAEPEWLERLEGHGITHLNLANNHSMDQGRKGLVDTRTQILKYNMTPLGFGMNAKEACKSSLLATYPRKVYLLSSLQVPSENWTFLENQPCVCEESFEAISERIKEIKDKDANAAVIVQLHWGVEHTLKPMILQKQQAYQLIDAGADVIVGHHPHTVQTVELYKEKPIYYSIGNFIFDQKKPINSKGLLVSLKIYKEKIVSTQIEIDIENCVPKIRK